MRKQAMKLKREGKEDEMERMFANALANDKGMIEILGMSKEQYLKSLEEKYVLFINYHIINMCIANIQNLSKSSS